MNDVTSTSTNPAATPLRLVAAALVLVGGLTHLQLYFDGYRDFPNHNLGHSFLLNGVASALIAAALVVRGDLVVRIAGIVVSAGTLVAFALSRSDRGIFGFTEKGLEPSPQATLTLICEIGAIVILAVTFVPVLSRSTPIRLPIAGGIAVVVLAFTGVMSGLWARSPEPAAAAAPQTTVAGVTTTVAGAPDAGATTTIAGAPAAAGSAVTANIASFAFDPPEIDVKVGGSVTWTNQDSVAHTVSGKDKSFDSGNLDQGATFTQTFATAGTFPYICNIHPSMSGTVVVTP